MPFINIPPLGPIFLIKFIKEAMIPDLENTNIKERLYYILYHFPLIYNGIFGSLLFASFWSGIAFAIP